MLRLRSPAKINLFLRILRKREDGFHELASLFQAIDLFDILTFQHSQEDRFTCSDPHLPLDENNLIIRALHRFRTKTNLDFPVQIHLEKNIPIQAGLGGGSSNAATSLYALNQLASAPLTQSELMQLGQTLGSDVPFFFSTGSAYCTGRGEKVQNVDISPLSFALHKPSFGSSTPEVYRALSLSTTSLYSPEALLETFQAGKPQFVNDLETPAFSIYPELKNFQKSLMQSYQTVLMSGSGSAFICLGGEGLPNRTIIRSLQSWY